MKSKYDIETWRKPGEYYEGIGNLSGNASDEAAIREYLRTLQ